MEDHQDKQLRPLLDRLKHAGKSLDTLPLPAFAPASDKNNDMPRAGELSSKVFTDLTTRIIEDLEETIESQINDAVNRRGHALSQIEALKHEIDKVMADYEGIARRHQEKVKLLADKVRQKVEQETKEMISLGQRLRDFADSVDIAHQKFFKEEK
jgi:hypothetical protein